MLLTLSSARASSNSDGLILLKFGCGKICRAPNLTHSEPIRVLYPGEHKAPRAPTDAP